MKIKYEYESNDKRVAAYDDNKEVGECCYSSNGPNCWVINHTYVNPEYRGKNIAEQLVKNVVERAKENKVKIIPLCPYVSKEFSKKPEYREMEYEGSPE